MSARSSCDDGGAPAAAITSATLRRNTGVRVTLSL